MMKPESTNRLARAGALAISALALAMLAGCQPPAGQDTAKAGVEPKLMADALHAVMESDRTVYTRNVINRLTKEYKVIKATEHWKDEPTLPLPAQMFRMGAEMVAKKDVGFSYSLLSMWPINKQNTPRTDTEIQGLEYVASNKGSNFYAEEVLGDQKYFTAVYADTAVAPACVSCHNEHKDSPKVDFELGDVMGGVVLRIPIGS